MTSPSLCSADWDDAVLPAWGTAKDASVIVCVEQAGPWGRDAVGASGLESPSGAVLYLIRRAGAHARNPERRHVIVSGGFADVPWLVQGDLADADVSQFLRGDVTNPEMWEQFGLTPCVESVLLVCTNGKRDACCAVRGRPVAAAAHAANPNGVWEVSHIGGHRFAPTAIHLPSGQTFGRLTEADGERLATIGRSGTLPDALFSPAKHRGRVDLTNAQRVAETWWREHSKQFALIPPIAIGPTHVSESGESVELPDGRNLLVTAHAGPELRDSCVKLGKPSSYFEAEVSEPSAS